MSPSKKNRATFKGAGRKKRAEDSSRAHEARLARGRGKKKTKTRRKGQAGNGRPAALELRADGKVRLNKYLADHGIASRRKCDELIVGGMVLVDGEPAVKLGTRIDPTTQTVEAKGTVLKPEAVLEKRYYLLNKPVGVVTTADDPQGRPVVVGLVPDEPRVFPVGRLDLDTEGLLLLTNDGEIANRITHPSYGVEKEYVVHVEGSPTRSVLRQLREGVELDDGVTAPARVTPVEPNVLRLVIHEGRNRQVRRMCDAVGHPVIRLVRTRIGPLADRSIRPGTWRHLETDELRALERAVADGA